MRDTAWLHAIGKVDGKDVVWFVLHGYITVVGSGRRFDGANSITDAVLIAEEHIPNFKRRKKYADIKRG